MSRLPGDPNAGRKVLFALGFRLPERNREWVRHELTDAGWRGRTIRRLMVLMVPICVALAFLPAGVMVVVLSTRMASLLGRFGPVPLTGLAFTCLVLAYAVFLRAGVHPDYPTVMLPATLLVGLAFGLGFSSLSVAATAGVQNAEQGLAASLFQTSFQVGGAVVLAVVTAALATDTAASWEARLRPLGVPAAAVRTLPEALQARPEIVATAGDFRLVGNPIRVAGYQPDYRPPPKLADA